MASNNEGHLLDSESDEELDSYPDVATRMKHKPRVPIEAHVSISNDDVCEAQAQDRDLGTSTFQPFPQQSRTNVMEAGGRPKAQSTSRFVNKKRPSKGSSARDSTMDFESEEDMNNFKKQALFWLQHPRIKENRKTVTAAFLLFFAGIAFAITGIVLASSGNSSDDTKSIIFFVCAAICILPGAYHIIYIYRATKGQKGYNFESIPSFQ